MFNTNTIIPEYIVLWDNSLYAQLKRKFKADRIRTKYIPESDSISITVEYTALNCKYHKIIEEIHDQIIRGVTPDGYVRELYNVILTDTKKLFFR